MNDRAVNVLENYELEVLRTQKSRGAILFETAEGLYILKEYRGTSGRLEAMDQMLQAVYEQGFTNVERPVRNREGGLITKSQDQTPYIVKTYTEGRECNVRELRECQAAVLELAKLHCYMELPGQEWAAQIPVFSLEAEYGKRNRELKKVRRFLKEKGQKNSFEIYLQQNYEFFYQKALAAAEELNHYRKIFDPNTIREAGSFCHGDFQHHNIIWGRNGLFFINFEKYQLDNQVRDLYQFLRKLLEKNNWSVMLGANILEFYQKEKKLTAFDEIQLYYRLIYPEKFWKIVNFYYNNSKAWIPERNMEKFDKILRQEEAKTAFLEQTFQLEKY